MSMFLEPLNPLRQVCSLSCYLTVQVFGLPVESWPGALKEAAKLKFFVGVFLDC